MTHAYVGGIAARSERYMRDHWARAKNFIDGATLQQSARQEEDAFASAQREAGLDLLAPALVHWEDLLRPFQQTGSGITTGQLVRYFETNTFFRQPVIEGPVHFDPQTILGSVSVPAHAPWVLTLPSPWDFAVRSKNLGPDATTRQVALALGQALRPVVEAARRAGAAVIRFHDPSIAYRRAGQRDVDACIEALAQAGRGHEAACTLHITNGDPFDIPDVLTNNPLGGVSLEDPGRPPPKGLALANGTRLSIAGLRGEDSLVEDAQALATRAKDLAQRLGLPLWGITNGWDLDHVPHAIAQRKLAVLGSARVALQEVPA